MLLQKMDAYGNPIVAHNNNPLIDLRFYTVEFDDGMLCEYV